MRWVATQITSSGRAIVRTDAVSESDERLRTQGEKDDHHESWKRCGINIRRQLCARHSSRNGVYRASASSVQSLRPPFFTICFLAPELHRWGLINTLAFAVPKQTIIPLPSSHPQTKQTQWPTPAHSTATLTGSSLRKLAPVLHDSHKQSIS